MFKDVFNGLQVNPGNIAITWTGQAGFLLKTAENIVLAIDPYLSDFVYETSKQTDGFAFKRVSPPLFEANEVNIDILLSSHEHGDHLDIFSISGLMKKQSCLCYANRISIKTMQKWGLPIDRVREIKKGNKIEFKEFSVSCVDCDHGELAPDAMGFILDFGFTKVYYSGDTCLNTKRLQEVLSAEPDVALLPINGAYGNLGPTDAAQYASMLKCRICIPHHFWTFPKHFGNPMDAVDAFTKYASGCELKLVTPGEIITVGII